MKQVALGLVWALAAGVSFSAQDSAPVIEESFEGYESGAPPARPWLSSADQEGITVAVASPAGAGEGERWIRLEDPVGESDNGNANIRRELPEMSYGELRFRLHVASLARLGVYLGTWPASRPEYRTVGFKMHEDGVILLVNDMLDQRSPWRLKAGKTYDIRLAFVPRDETYTTVTLTVDEGGSTDTLEAVVPKGDPITGIRLTTENLDAGGDFYITDIVLTRTDSDEANDGL